MKVLVSGASGLIGSALAASLSASGDEVVRLVRGTSSNKDTIAWQPLAGVIDEKSLEGFDAVVHLAGENVAQRWTPEIKAAIRTSRINGTQTLAAALARVSAKPKVFVSASAVGYYGNRGAETLNESTTPADDYLAVVCRDWESAAQPAADAGICTVNARIGVVLSSHGGALAKMLPIFSMGMGGCIGSGDQYMSWIALDDVVEAIKFCIRTGALSGPVNVVAPEPVTNAEFSRMLGAALKRPAFMPLPAPAAKLMFGEMAEALLLAGQRVLPLKLESAGYEFRQATLPAALAWALKN